MIWKIAAVRSALNESGLVRGVLPPNAFNIRVKPIQGTRVKRTA
jgi:hypothetical protein